MPGGTPYTDAQREEIHQSLYGEPAPAERAYQVAAEAGTYPQDQVIAIGVIGFGLGTIFGLLVGTMLQQSQ